MLPLNVRTSLTYRLELPLVSNMWGAGWCNVGGLAWAYVDGRQSLLERR